MPDFLKHLDLALHYAEQIIKEQNQSWEIIDQKNSTLIAAYGVVFAVASAISIVGKVTQGKLLYGVFLAVLLVFTVIGISCSFVSLFPRRKVEMPNPEGILISYSRNNDFEQTKKGLFSHLTNAIDTNDNSLKAKRQPLTISIICFPISLAFLFIIFMYRFFS